MADEENKTTEETTTEENKGSETTETTEETTTEEFKDDGAEPQGRTPAAGDEGDDEEVTDEDKKAIGKIVNETVAPLQDQLFQNVVETSLQAIYSQNPDYKQFDAKIRRFVNHPNRAGMIKSGALPVKTVVLEAISDHLPSLLAKKTKIADDKANLAKDGGNQQGATEQNNRPDFKNMPTQDVEKVMEGVRAGTYKLPKV